MFLLSELESTGDRLVGKTFGELNRSQQIFFENTSRTLDDVDQSISEGLDQADEIVSHVEQLVAQVPFTKQEPRLRSATPDYIMSPEGDVEQTTVFRFRGSFLHHGEATLLFAGVSCAKIGHNDTNIEFECSNRNFITDGSILHQTGELTVEDYRSGWDRFRGIFGNTRRYKTYNVSVSSVPRQMGTYSLSAVVSYDTEETRSRSGSWGHVNPHCRSSRSSTSNFGPSGQDWTIAVGSISTSVTNERRGSHRLENVSENGFQVSATARNSGSCFGPAKDSRGASQGNAYWTEVKRGTATQNVELSSGPLFWNQDVLVDLPPRTQAFSLVFNRLDGAVEAFNSAEPGKWLVLNRDASSTSLVLSPRSIDRAMDPR